MTYEENIFNYVFREVIISNKITIKKSCLKYCFKAGNYYDFKRRLYLLFLMKGWISHAEILHD